MKNRNLRAITLACLSLFFSLLFLFGPSAAHADVPVSGFGTNGLVTGLRHQGVNGVDNYTPVWDAKFQADGKILIAGKTGIPDSYSAYIARVNQNGTIDSTFGTNGWTTVSFGNTGFDNVEFKSISVLPNGKILATGQRMVSGLGERPIAARFHTDGALDTSFAGTGYLTVTESSPTFTAVHVGNHSIMSDGSVLIVGTCENPTDGISELFLSKISTNGALVPGFGSSGLVCISPFPILDQVWTAFSTVSVDKQDNIFVSGEITLSSEILVGRITSNGQFDQNYGDFFPSGQTVTRGGFTQITIGTGPATSNSSVMTDSGSVITSGRSTNGSGFFGSLVKTDSSLVQQLNFGTSGLATYTQGSTATSFDGSAIDCLDNTYISGSYVYSFAKNAALLTAFSSSGQQLSNFSGKTLSLPSSQPSNTQGTAVALDGGNKVILVGYQAVNNSAISQEDVVAPFISMYETPNQNCSSTDASSLANTSIDGNVPLLVVLGIMSLTMGAGFLRMRKILQNYLRSLHSQRERVIGPHSIAMSVAGENLQ